MKYLLKLLFICSLMTANVMLQAEPIDSLINKSVDKFGDFISKKQGNEYFFSFDITKDGNNPAYREYTPDAGGEIFKDNINEYNAIISTVINFNTNYNPSDFELYIFHGRYYTDSERVLVREVNAIFDNNTFADEENKLRILKNVYQINTDAKYLVKNLRKRVLDKIKTEKPGKRILVLFAIEFKCIKYEKLEDAQLRPYNITYKEAHIQKHVFWGTTGMSEEEKKVHKYIQDIRTQPKTILDSTYNFVSVIEDLPSALKSLTNLVTEGLLLEKNRGEILSNSISNNDLIKLLNSFSEYQFSLLTWQERVAILSRFSKRPMTEEWLWGLAGNNTENIAIKVLATAPQEQYGDIIHYFEMTDADLLQNLVYRIDGDNFASLISYLSQYTYYQRSQPLLNESNVSQYIKNQRFLGFDDWKALPYEAGKYSRIDFAVRKNFHWNYQYELKDIDAFQYVLVRFDDDFSTERGNYYPKGYIDFIPAITLYGLYNEAANRRIRLFVDGLGFATGVAGMVRQSGKALTISLIDMGIAVTDITLSLVLVDELNKTEEGKEVLLYWNRFAMVYAGYTGVRMTGLVLTHGQRFYQSAKKWLSKKINPELKKIIDDLEVKEPEVKNTPPVEVNGAGNLQAIKNSIISRIAVKQGWSMKYTDAEIEAILTHGKGINLPESEIEDIILNGCRPDKNFTKADLISQTNFWNTVKQRGYPNLFQSLKEYEKFSDVVKSLAKEWNLPENSIFVQGSSLRMSNVADISDLDIAIKVNANTFDNLANRFEEAATANFKKQAIIDDKAKGILRGGNMHMKDANGTFTANFYNKFKSSFNIEYSSKFPNKGFQISIIKEDSSFDVSPYLNLK